MRGPLHVLLCLLVVLLTVQGQQQFCLDDALVNTTKSALAQLDYANWDSARLNAEVAAILLREVGGFEVTYTPSANGTYDWEGMANGRKDINFEVWDEGREDEIDPYIDARQVSRIGALGVLGLNGWFMSSFAMDAYPPYASWRPLADCANVGPLESNRTSNSTLGELAGTDPGWILSQGSLQVVENNDLCIEWVEYNSSADYLEVWEQAVVDRESFLMTYWEPTEIFARYLYANDSESYYYRLDRVSLPRWTPECQALFGMGYNCDFQPSVIGKYMTSRQDLNPELANFYQKFSMNNGDHERMLGYLNYVENATYFDTACEWVKENRDKGAKWEDWFWECEQDCSGGVGVCQNGTCVCLVGYRGEYCQFKIEDEYFFCGNQSIFVDESGLIYQPDLTNNPEYIPLDLVCDEIIDCDNWADESLDQNCSPTLVGGIIAWSTIVSLSILAVLISLIFVWLKRARGRIRAAGVEFLTQLHIGVMWGMSSCYLFMGKASDAKCGMTPYWIALSSALVIGSLVAKQYKVWKVLSHKGFQVIRVTNTQLVAITCVIVAIDLIVLIIWSAIDLPKLGIREVSDSYHPLCTSDDFLPFFVVLVAYKFSIILVSAALAWKSRGLPSAYSEAKHIGFALYNAVFLMVCFIPIILATNDVPFLTWILIQAGLWFWYFSIYLIVVGFIIAGLYRDRHLDESEKNALPDVSKSKASGTTGKSTTPM